MVSYEYYTGKMEEVFKLMGIDNKANRDMAKAIYERIKGNYENTDLGNALESLMQSENPKINFPIMIKHLNSKRALRFEEKSRLDKENGAETAKQFWSMETRDNCRTHNCRYCPHLAERCDTIAHHTFSAIKLMIGQRWQARPGDMTFEDYYHDARTEQRNHNKQILAELDRQFPGAGFGIDYDVQKKQIYTRDELRGNTIMNFLGTDAHDF